MPDIILYSIIPLQEGVRYVYTHLPQPVPYRKRGRLIGEGCGAPRPVYLACTMRRLHACTIACLHDCTFLHDWGLCGWAYGAWAGGRRRWRPSSPIRRGTCAQSRRYNEHTPCTPCTRCTHTYNACVYQSGVSFAPCAGGSAHLSGRCLGAPHARAWGAGPPPCARRRGGVACAVYGSWQRAVAVQVRGYL